MSGNGVLMVYLQTIVGVYIMKIAFSLMIERIRLYSCPVCGGKDLEYDEEMDDGLGRKCNSCKAYWSLNVEFTGIHTVGHERDGVTCEEDVEIVDDLTGIDHIPEILMVLLDMPEILPLFIGINAEFDKLISGRMSL